VAVLLCWCSVFGWLWWCFGASAAGWLLLAVVSVFF
jgi:hypothetical protein